MTAIVFSTLCLALAFWAAFAASRASRDAAAAWAQAESWRKLAQEAGALAQVNLDGWADAVAINNRLAAELHEAHAAGVAHLLRAGDVIDLTSEAGPRIIRRSDFS